MINISKLYCDKSGASDELRYPPQRGLKPIVVFNCTARCNLRCVHCYSDSDCAVGTNELTTPQAQSFIRQVAEYACPVLLFSGGEPLLRDDIFELMTLARKLNLRIVLSTNGTLITKNIAKRLYDIGLSYAGISLDGPKEIHDQFRGQEGCFDAAMKGIETCLLAGLRTGIRCTISRQNIESVGDIFDIAEQNGVRRLCFYHLIRTGRAAAADVHPAAPHQVRDAMDEIISRTAESVYRHCTEEVLTVGNHADGPYLLLRMHREHHHQYDTAKELLLRAAGNRTGQNIAAVSWDGSVHPDQFWRNYSLGNVLDKSFGQIWDNVADPVLKILRDKDTYKAARCARCKWFDLCKGNFRCPSGAGDVSDWFNEPACYLTDDEITL
ncbi:MAG: radical SAM protein [Planctomycetes bacterium]|nr:radical SAM protein [Planctomycetota bacterium]